MLKTSSLFILFCFLFNQVQSQILPEEGSKLNYRLIGFSFPNRENTDSFTIEIAKGIITNSNSFKKNIIKSYSGNKNRIIAEVPFWGEDYTWRIIYTKGKFKGTLNGFHHFSTLIIPEVDTNKMRLRILHAAEKYKDAFVLLDNNKVMYDMNGSSVWFLPDNLRMGPSASDLKLSPAGTLTMLIGTQAYEINYNGLVLWKAPNTGKISGDTTENYNHEFTRLSNGHYMILGNENVFWRPATSIDNNNILNSDTLARHRNMFFGTIIEYDKMGNVVWSWKSSNYFLESDINYCNPLNHPLDLHARDIMDTHENAFYFDEKNKNIYAGYKAVNRILKVKYPEGNVTNVYGNLYKFGVPQGEDLFCGQHSISVSKSGNLILFDNHFCDREAASRVIILKEPEPNDSEIKKVWEFPFTYDDSKTAQNCKGGNVVELADSSLFVCMGIIYSKLFIITMNKHELWSAVPEVWNDTEKKWNINSQYRSSIIENRQQLEKMIWNNEEPIFNAADQKNSNQTKYK